MKRKRRIVLYSLAGCLLVAVAVLRVFFDYTLEKKREYDRAFANLLSHTVYAGQVKIEYHSSWLGWIVGDIHATHLLGSGAFRAVTLNRYETPTVAAYSGDQGLPPKPYAVHTSLLEHLGSLPRLERLDLNGILFPTNDFSPLTNLPELRHLSLRGTNTTDLALHAIGTFTQLETLDLRQTAITDQGLNAIAALSSLKQLFLQETEVTQLGVAELQKSLPNCDIAVTFLNGSARYRDKEHFAGILIENCLYTHSALFGPIHSLRVGDSYITDSDNDRFTVKGHVVVTYDVDGHRLSHGPFDFTAILERESSHWHLARVKGTANKFADRFEKPYDLILRE